MHCPSRFASFIQAISPSPKQRKDMRAAHIELRERLERDSTVKPNLVTTFIQGSYRRHTGLLGSTDHPCDVDVVVVTRIPSAMPAWAALDLFKPFLEANYKNKYRPQDRSWGITHNADVEMDLVPTSAPSEAWSRFIQGNAKSAAEDFDFEDPVFEMMADKGKTNTLVEAFRKIAGPDWQKLPLEIPDRSKRNWSRTHPLAQIAWTSEKNGNCNGHYTNVVRAIKWWKRTQAIDPKYPKGYPLEHLIGVDCPVGITSIAEGFTKALETLATSYRGLVAAGSKPTLPDHGVPEHDVLKRVEKEDFCAYYQKALQGASAARNALDDPDDTSSARKWHALLGPSFPKPDDDAGGDPTKPQSGDKFTARSSVSSLTQPTRFA